MQQKTIDKLDKIKSLMASGLNKTAAADRAGLTNSMLYSPEAKAYLAKPLGTTPIVKTYDADDTPVKSKFAPRNDKLNKSEVALAILQNKTIPAAARIDLAVSFLG